VSRKERRALFYGWWIVLASCLAAAVGSSFAMNSTSIFFPLLEEEFGWSRAAISAGLAIGRAEAGVIGPMEGYLVDRWGPRLAMLTGMGILGLGLLLFSQVNSLLSFYLVFFLVIALGHGLGAQVAPSVAVANWFRRRRGLAYGIFRSGPGLGGFFLLLVSFLVVALGWRQTVVVMGFITLAVGLPMALVMRTRPEDYGYLPDGAALETPQPSRVLGEGAIPAHPPREEPHFTVGQALRTSRFWLLGISIGLRVAVTTAVTLHLVVMLVDRGIAFTLAGALLGTVEVVSIVGRLGLGWLGDYLDRRRLMMGALVLLGASVFLMGQTADLRLFVPATLVFALTLGGLASSQDALRADYFGTHSFGAISGFNRSLQTVGGVLGPIMAGLIYDNTHSYHIAFTIFAAAALLSMVCLALCRRPRLFSPPHS